MMHNPPHAVAYVAELARVRLTFDGPDPVVVELDASQAPDLINALMGAVHQHKLAMKAMKALAKPDPPPDPPAPLVLPTADRRPGREGNECDGRPIRVSGRRADRR